MNTAAANEPRFVRLKVTDEAIIAELADGRTVSVPLAWSWRLSEATTQQRNNFEFIGSGEGATLAGHRRRHQRSRHVAGNPGASA